MFLSSRNASAGDRSVFGSFWFEPVGMRSSTGLRVTAGSAMRLAAVYSCVRVLAETFAILPFQLWRRRTDGGRDMVTDHWLYRLIARRPNQWQTPFEWREMMMGHLCLRGNAFNQIIANGKGEITDLIPLHPDMVKIEVADTGDYRYRVTQRDATTMILSRGEVWHIRGLSSDGIIGLNPMELASEVVGLGLAAQNYGARFFANDTKPGGWIEAPPGFQFADDDAKKTFKADWNGAYGGKNRGKTAILTHGMKYHELALNNSDAQFLESRKYSRSELASLFRVPPHKIGDLERSTFSNIEQQSLDFVNDTMTPWAERWEASIEFSLLPENDADLEIEFDFANLLRGDMAARTAYYTGNINNGSLTRNEARIAEGRNPIDGLDAPLQPLNMVEAGKQPSQPAQAEAAPAVPATPNKHKEGRAQALATAAAERIARKETAVLLPLVTQLPMPVDQIEAAMTKHAEFIAATLGVPLEAAQAYNAARGRDPINRDSAEADIYQAALDKLQILALKGSL